MKWGDRDRARNCVGNLATTSCVTDLMASLAAVDDGAVERTTDSLTAHDQRHYAGREWFDPGRESVPDWRDGASNTF